MLAEPKITNELKSELTFVLSQIDNYKKEDLAALFKKYEVSGMNA